MGFLSHGDWWISFVVLIISCFIAQSGVLRKGKSFADLLVFGSALIIGTIIATFIFTGWQGGLAILVLSLVFSYIAFSVMQRFIGRPND